MSGKASVVGEDLQARTRHRVANTFHFLSALARMRAQREAGAAQTQGLSWMADMIIDLGAMERCVCPEGIDVGSYFAAMSPIWRDRYRRLGLEVAVETCPLILTEAAAPSLVLIVLELVAHWAGQSFQADQSRALNLHVQAQGPGYVLTLRGAGFAQAYAQETFGLWLAKRLSQQIKGELALDKDDSVTLSFQTEFQS